MRSRRAFVSEHGLQAVASRDFLYYATNVGLSAFAAAVLFATVVVPLAMGQTVQAATFEALARPLGVLTLLAVGVCALLDWKHTQATALLRRLAVPGAAFAAAVAALAATAGRAACAAWSGLGVCAFTGAAALQLVVARARRAGGGQGLLIGLRRMLTGRRSRLAALVAHLGMAVVVAGLIGSTVYKVEQRQTIDAKPGAHATVGAYTLTFVKFRSDTGPQGAERTYAVLEGVPRGPQPGADRAPPRLLPVHRPDGRPGGHPGRRLPGPVRLAGGLRPEAADAADGRVPAHPLRLDRGRHAGGGRRRLALAAAAPAGGRRDGR